MTRGSKPNLMPCLTQQRGQRKSDSSEVKILALAGEMPRQLMWYQMAQ